MAIRKHEVRMTKYNDKLSLSPDEVVVETTTVIPDEPHKGLIAYIKFLMTEGIGTDAIEGAVTEILFPLEDSMDIHDVCRVLVSQAIDEYNADMRAEKNR